MEMYSEEEEEESGLKERLMSDKAPPKKQGRKTLKNKGLKLCKNGSVHSTE